MKVSDLYAPNGPFVGREIYIVGTGPSMRVFPIEYLKNKTCILLNDACRFLPLGPVAMTNNRKWVEPLNNQLIKYTIIKARLKSDPNPQRDDNHVPWNHQAYYCFSYRDPRWDKVDHLDRAQLWQEPCHYWNIPGGTIAVFAVQFALQAGASAVILVGCDCNALHKDHYMSKKLQERKHANKKMAVHDYDAYAAGLMVMLYEARLKFGVPVMTLTPFCGLGRETSQFGELRSGSK